MNPFEVSELEFVNSQVPASILGLSDEDVVKIAISEGKSELFDFMVNKYKNFVRFKAKSYFLVGAEREDVVQEGMIGLVKAIKNFNNTRSISFRSFAEICIRRQIITAIKTANRKKHVPLNSYLPIVGAQKERSDNVYTEVPLKACLTNKIFDPQEIFTIKETFEILKKRMNRNLSRFEKRVLEMHVQGLNYIEIALKMAKTPKSIDNAIQRAKKKMNKIRYSN